MLLDCEYEILKDFGVKALQMYNPQTSRDFVTAFRKIGKEERLSYYTDITDFVFKLVHGNIDHFHPELESLQFDGYIRHSKIAPWKKRTFIHNSQTHILQLLNPRGLGSPTLDLSHYLVRKSKNADYNALVLEACDRRADPSARCVAIGLRGEEDYEFIYERIKKSAKIRQCQIVEAMYKGDALCRNSINSMRKQSFCDNF
jgi:hypothetical protein